ncbi:flagellar export chaperone FliS [Ramlibacter alkalitolerans]|uniref:Flagellar secretion chaperone FliS n=1 Tax=Ramlibacter alkalitolerans TaxID=2039631 RepID=A0ABS1JKX9_9BURK|nr:flagellar export chaperone FliS [Ramlibacter alkalitolerans]MBL0424880.1 flagellar export chaperone FliS [Ramlibacter alkalitolerans]
MFTSTLQPIAQYREVGTITAVSQADPHQLVLLLFDGALAAVLQARHAVATGDAPTRHTSISRAMRIIDEGLKASVMSEADPALADNLCGLYEHMVARLFTANRHGSDEPLAEVLKLLGELRSAWAEIAPAPVARVGVQA